MAFLWIFITSLLAVLGDLMFVSPYLAVHFSIILVFYLTVQNGWKLMWFPAVLLGVAIDAQYAGDWPCLSIFLPVVVVSFSRNWMRHGDCGVLPLQVFPIGLLVIFLNCIRLLGEISYMGSVSDALLERIGIILLSTVVTALCGPFVIYLADSFAEKIGLDTFVSVQKKRGLGHVH